MTHPGMLEEGSGPAGSSLCTPTPCKGVFLKTSPSHSASPTRPLFGPTIPHCPSRLPQIPAWVPLQPGKGGGNRDTQEHIHTHGAKPQADPGLFSRLLLPSYGLFYTQSVPPCIFPDSHPSPVDFLSASPLLKVPDLQAGNHTFQFACFPLSLPAASSFSSISLLPGPPSAPQHLRGATFHRA